MKHSFWKRFLALVMAIAIVLSTGVLDSAGWLLANNGEDTTQEPTGENTAPPSDQQGGSSTETLDLTTEPTVESTGATDPSEGGETEDETTESTPVKEVTLTVVIQSVYADGSQEGAVLGTEYLTYAEGEASKTIAVVIPAVEGYTFAVSGADMTLNAEGKYEASLSRPAESGMLYITVTYSPIVPEGEEGTEPETPAEGEEGTEPETPAEGEETTEPETPAEGEETTECVCPEDDCLLDECPACAAEDYSSCIFMQEFLGNGPAVGDLKPEDTTVYYTYTFEGDSEGKWTQIVKNGDSLELPEPPVQAGKAFVGWVDQDGNAVVAGPVTVSGTADKTITVSPSYRDVSYIYFQDNKGAICHTVEGIPGASMDSGEFAAAEAIAKGSITTTEKIDGWKLDGTIVTAVNFPASGAITLVPVVVPGYWVEFDTDGGEFMEPVFKDSGETLALPTPVKPGYIFTGWVNADGGAAVGGVTEDGVATGSVSGACQLKATWKASGSTNYTVLYWMENADDEDYTYLDFDIKTGTTGAQTNAGAMENATTRFPDLKYCTLVTVEQQDIKADGSTIVNVYYDRNEYTVTYQGMCDLDEHTHSWQNGCYARKSTCNGRHNSWQYNSHTASESCYDLTNLTCTKTEHTHGTCDTKTVKAKWGADISDTWPGGNFRVSSTGKYQASINTMPTYNETFTLAYAEPEEDGNGGWIDADVAYYYMQKLDGTYGDGEGEVIPFPIEDGNWTITSDDAFGFTGFTYSHYVTDGNTYSGNNFGGTYDGAKFYYTRNSYDIELKYYDGTEAQVNGVSKLTYKYQQPIPANVLPAAGPAPQAGRGPDEGYTFKGWYWDTAGEKPVTLPEAMPAYGLVVYAIWERQPVEANIYITVKTETNGVMKVMEVPYGYMLSEVTSVTEEQAAKGLMTYTQVLAALEAQNPGKNFLGWVTESGAPFLESTKITSAITLYPVFDGTGDAYTVTYVESGAEAAVVDLTKYRANSQAYIKAPVNATNTAGQKFSYWQGSDGLTYVPGQAVAISGDVTLTAVYAQPPVKASITYHSNTNTAADESWESGMIYLVNQKVTPDGYPADKPTKTGYSFAGWSLTANGAVVGTVVIDSRTNNNLYAVWVPNRNDVTYEYTNEAPEGASDVPAGKTEVAYGTEVSVEANPTVPAGWAFSGWTTSDATVTDGKFSMPDNDVKFVGTWTKLDFKVTYEYTGTVPAGAPEVPEQATVTMGQDYTVAADPEVDGYTFNGWLKDGEEVTSFEMPASDVTLIGSFSKRTDLGYIVKYVWGETELISTTKEVSNQTFGTTVTESAIDITGYTLNDDASKSITITTGENVIVFHYNKDVTFTGETATKVYNGTEQTITGIDVSGLKTGHTYTDLTYAAKGTNVGTYDGAFSGDVIIKDANGNDVTKYYNVTKTPGKLTITKASLNLVITGKSDTKTYNGSEQEVTGFESEGLLTGHTITGLTHTAKGTNVGEYTGSFTGTVKVMDGETDVTENYAITQNPGKLTITASSDWKLTATGYENVYDGQAHAATASANVAEGTTVSYKVGEGEWTTTAPTITDVGEVTVQVKAENPNYNTLATTVTLKVTPRSITITADGATKTYDGDALTMNSYSITEGSLATGDKIDSVTVTGSITNVGTVDNVPSEAVIKDGDTVVTGNYDITYSIGKLNINKRPVTFTGESDTKTYTGKEQSITGISQSGLVTGHEEVALSYIAKGTNKGEYPGAFSGDALIKDADGNDVTANYEITKTPGQLTINATETELVVTIKGNTKTETYNGTEFTVEGYTHNAPATVSVTLTGKEAKASGTNAGTYTMGLTADDFTVTSENYSKITVKVEDGWLKINPISEEIIVTIVGDNNTTDYDGKEHSVSGFTANTEHALYNVNTDVKFVGTATAARTDAGTTNMGLAKEQFSNTNGNFSNVTFKVTDGYQTINPINVTVTIVGKYDTDTYDGTEHSVSGYTATADSELYDVEKDFNFSGTAVAKRTVVGTTMMDLAADQFKNNNKNFETVTFNVTDGYQTVTMITTEIVITADSNSKTYDGQPLTDDGYTYTEGVLAEGDVLTAVVEGSQTDVGTADNVVTSYKVMRGDVDVTANYTFGASVDGTLEVTKRKVTLTSATDSKEYDGKALTNATVTVTGDGFATGEGATYAVTGSQTLVGTSENKFTYTLNEGTKAANYDITVVPGTLEITAVTDKVTVTITERSGTEKYDGEEKTVTGYDVDIDNELYTEDDFTFSGNATVKGTNAGTYEMALKAADFINISKNFTNVKFVIVDGTLEITKRSVTLTSGDGEKVYDGAALTNSDVTVSGDGFVEGEGAEYTVTGTQTAEGSSANTFTYTLNAGTLAGNYDIKTVEGTLTVTALTDEIVVTITEHSGEYKYDGKEKTVSGYDVEISSKLYTEDDFSFNGTASVSGIDAGTYEMELKPEDFTNKSENFTNVKFVIVDGTLEITKRSVTLTSGDGEKVYDGAALTNSDVTVSGDGFAEGEGAEYSVTGTITNVGDVKNEFTYTLNDNTKEGNYEITVVPGTLVVTPVEDKVTVTITEHSGTEKYDGTEKTVTGYDVSIDNELYFEKDFTFSGNATVSGTDAGTYEMELKSDDFTNISANFADVEFIIVDGTLEISKRTVTMTSADDSKVYDGTALTNDTVTVTGDGFAKGEGAEYSVTGTITNVGDVKNEFTYTLNEGTKADNYIIKTVEGTLTVTAVTDKVTVVITENSDTVVYDGEEHSVKGYEVTSISNPLYTVDDFTFSGNAAVNAVDAGVYDMLLTSGNFTNKSTNFANVEFVIVDGQLAINKRNVTLTSASDSKEYDGIALTAKTVEITAGSFAPNEGYTVNITGSQTLVGKSDNTFTYALTQNTKSCNYEITVVYGELQVTDRTEPFVVVVEANSGEHVYDGQPFTVSGLKEATVARMAARIDGQTVTFLLNGETYTISGLHAERTETHVNPAAPTAVDVLPYSGYEVAITGTPVITDSEGNDVTKQFTVETISGVLTIHPAPVTMVSGDATKPYDGTELIKHEVTVEGFMEGEGASYDVTGTQTLVGSSENAFTYTLNEGTQAQDYRIETTFGTLTVTAPEDYEIIDKTHTTETLYRLGDTVTFDITVKNIFSEEAKVVITEQEGVSILWNGAKVQSVETTIPAGETITLQAEYTLQEKDILAGEFTNVVDANIKATVDKIPYEGDDDDEDKVDEIEDPKAKLTLDKVTTSTPANGSKYVVGETITYKITATNSGNLTLHDVFIYDVLTGESQSKYAVETDPVEYTFELDVNLAPGETATVTYSHTVTEEDLGKNLINAVTGSAGNSSETDDEEKNDTPTDVIPDEVKDPTDDIRRDLDVEKSVLNYRDPYRISSYVEYEIVVTNNGNVTERDVIVSDIIDAHGAAKDFSFTDLGSGLLLPGNRVLIPVMAPGETVNILCHYWIGANDEALPINNKATVESADGETGDEDDAETVMVEKLYNLTIYYLTDDWQTVLAPEYHGRYGVGYTYYVESPEIEGYTPNYEAIWSGYEGMPDHDVECYVLYSKLPEETTEPTTEPTDPSEETTEPTTAPTEPTYDLTEIPEEEVPLGDVDLGDHTCCIMHFLIMLVAMILLGFYTKDRKKYQERIHELKRSLAAEDAAAAAAGEEQA